MSANDDVGTPSLANDAQQVYERLEELVKSMYESISVSDYHELVVFAQALALDNDLVHEVQHSDPEVLRQRILDELEEELAEERRTTPPKILECFQTYPVLRDFFQSDLLKRMIQERFNKNALITKFRENPHLLFQDSNSDVTMPSGLPDPDLNVNSPDDTDAVPIPDCTPEQNHSLPVVIAETDTNDNPTSDTQDDSEQDDDSDHDDDDFIVSDLFTNCAAAFLHAYTGHHTSQPLTILDSCR